jgi:hypothetical protein
VGDKEKKFITKIPGGTNPEPEDPNGEREERGSNRSL